MNGVGDGDTSGIGAGRGFRLWVVADGRGELVHIQRAGPADIADIIRYQSVLGHVTRWLSFTLARKDRAESLVVMARREA